jgi:hypothetical protein
MPQVYAHGAALLERERNHFLHVADQGFDVGSATVGLVAAIATAWLAPPVALAIAAGVAGKTAVKSGASFWEVVRRRGKSVSRPTPVDPTGEGRPEIVSQMVSAICRLSEAIPIVLVLDNAHDADLSVTSLLKGIFAESAARVLVLALVWPSHIDGAFPRRPFAKWLTEEDQPRMRRTDLSPLSQQDLASMVYGFAPNTDPQLVDALVAHLTNPYSLRAALSLDRVSRHIAGDAVVLSVHAVASLPTLPEDLFAEAWNDLPVKTQLALSVAATCGYRYLPRVVLAAAEAAGLVVSEADLEAAVTPHHWAREIDLGVYGFDEPLLRDVALRKRSEFLSPSEISAALDSVAAEARRKWDRLDYSETGRMEILRSYLDLMSRREVRGNQRTLDLALELAKRHSARRELIVALEVLEYARRWAKTPERRLTMATARAFCLAQNQQYKTAAISELTEALGVARRSMGDDHRAVLEAESDICLYLSHGGDMAEAIQRGRQLIPRIRRSLGGDDHLCLIARENLMEAVGLAGNPWVALRLTRMVLRDLTRYLGPRDPLTLVCRGYLSYWTAVVIGPRTAIAMNEELIPLLTEVLGSDDTPTLGARVNLADWHRDLDELPEAERLYLDVLPELEWRLGPAHDMTLKSRAFVAQEALGRADWERAIALTEEVAQFTAIARGPGHRDTLQERLNLGFTLWQSGRIADALTTYEGLLPDLHRYLGPDDSMIAEVASDIAELQVLVGQG